VARTSAQPINCKVTIQTIPPPKIVLLITVIRCLNIMSDVHTRFPFSSNKT